MIEKIQITGREMWLDLRRQDITASDIPAVVGEGMYGSAASVWAEKKGLLPPKEMNDALRRGRWGEPAVFEALSELHPDWEIRRAKVYLRDPEARIGATPDGMAIVPGREGLVAVQTKVVAAPVFKKDWLLDSADVENGPAQAPLGYQLQTLTEVMLSEASAGLIAALVVDTFKWVLREFWLERHPPAETMIREKVAFFQERYLDAGVAPPVDPERDHDLVRKMYPVDDGSVIDLTGDNALPDLLEERETLKAKAKDCEERIETIDTEIRGKMGDHKVGLVNGWTIRLPAIEYKEYTVAARTTRRLTVKRGS